MSGRALASGNVSHINSRNTHPVLMANFQFTGSPPVYVHSGLGNIIYDGNTYLGVGSLGGVDGLEETEALVPAPVRVSLSGLDPAFFAEALNAANYGDKATLYIGYRNDDGTLVDEPWIFYRGRIEHSRVIKGVENVVVMTIQHELAVLNKKTGTKFTDEEQQRRYPGDTAFQFVQDMATIQLKWGRSGAGAGNRRERGPAPGGDWNIP